MKNQTRVNDNTGKEISIHYANGLTAGHGHKKIEVEIEYKNEYKKFHATTSNMPSWDDAQDLEGEEKYTALYEMIESQIEDEIAEWIMEIDEEN